MGGNGLKAEGGHTSDGHAGGSRNRGGHVLYHSLRDLTAKSHDCICNRSGDMGSLILG